MRAVLLAAGLGTRLRPLTDHTPKCLVEVGGRPLLDYWLYDLHQAGFKEFLINTHHLPEQVEAFVARHPLRSRITLVHEDTLRGTAGTLLANVEFLQPGTTLIAHADNLCLCRWADFIGAHRGRPAGALMTMMTFHTAAPRDCGIVETDDQGILRAFHEKVSSPPGNEANAAIYLMEPAVARLLADMGSGITDFSNQVIPKLVGRTFTWHNDGVLVDIGTPERLAWANALNLAS